MLAGDLLINSVLDPAPEQLENRACSLDLDQGYLADVQLLCSIERLTIMLELPQTRRGCASRPGTSTRRFQSRQVVWNVLALEPYTVAGSSSKVR